ncbi:MAG: hypothetical protein PHF25_06655 [Candidatus Margulisbacteria bacterium]|nr:hypothetical protein [Candidatus Margulisiibacteriota bacterium]
MNNDNYPHSEVTDQIIKASYYVATGYKFKKLEIESSILHDKFKEDICILLNERSVHCVAEEFFPKPLREAVFKGKKIRHFADLMVQSKVLVEIKVGSENYLFEDRAFQSFQGQCLETLEYSGLDIILLLRMENNGEFKVNLKKFKL